MKICRQGCESDIGTETSLPVSVPSMPTAEELRGRLEQELSECKAHVVDTSGDCGSSFEVSVTSPIFRGQKLLARHRTVQQALGDAFSQLHALRIARTATPEEVSS